MLIYFKTIAGIILGETAIKHCIIRGEEKNKKARKLPGGIEICRLENKGAAGGVLSGHKTCLKAASGAALAACGLFLWKEKKKYPFSVSGMGTALLLGGGISNFIDRVKKGSVTDYVRFCKFPIKYVRRFVFNIGDFCILIGALLLAAAEIFRTKSNS